MASRLREFEVHGSKFKVDAKYIPIKSLGKGTYGIVCAALDSETGQKVAIKKITPAFSTLCDAKHTLREIRLMRHLGGHPNIICLSDMFVHGDEDELYVAMPLIDSDLQRIIQSPQTLGEAHFKHFLYQLLRGLRFAHRHGVIHRDIKPANILVTQGCELRIADFGLARHIPERGSPHMTEHVVTRWYRAPELMLSPNGEYTTAIDVWSVGCIFAELLGRRPLFPGKTFLDTLRMQFDVLGTPTADDLAYVMSDDARHFIAALPRRLVKTSWRSLFPSASDAALSILGQMLQFHPSKRVSVEDAMDHPYFDSVRLQYCAPEPVVAVGHGGFEFSFEYDAALDVRDYRRIILEEVDSFRAEKFLARTLDVIVDEPSRGAFRTTTSTGDHADEELMSAPAVCAAVVENVSFSRTTAAIRGGTPSPSGKCSVPVTVR